MAIKTVLNVSALAGIKLTSRLIGYTAFGIVFNMFLFLYFANSAGRHNSGLPWLLLCLTTLFAPVMYFLLGKKQGVAAAMHFLVEQHGQDLTSFVLGKLTDADPQLLDTAHQTGAVLHEKLNALMHKLSEQSAANKLVFNGLMQKFDFVSVISRVLENNPAAGSSSKEETVERIATALKEKLKLDDTKPDLRAPAKLVAVNTGVAFVCAAILPIIFR